MLSPRGGQIWLTGRSFIWPPLRQNSATWTSFDDDDKDRDDDEVEEDSVITEEENIEVQMWKVKILIYLQVAHLRMTKIR